MNDGRREGETKNINELGRGRKKENDSSKIIILTPIIHETAHGKFGTKTNL